MAKILLLGGSGFVGKNLVHDLYLMHEFFVVGRAIDKDFMKIHGVQYQVLDVSESEHLTQIIKAFEPEIVVNLISIVTASREIALFETMMNNHIKIAQSIYLALKDYQKLSLFVQIGSLEEYGNITAPFQEEAREYPNSPYAIAKQMTNNYFLMLHKLVGFPVTVWRLANLFGPYQDSSKFLPYVIETLSNQNELKMTHGLQKRDFLLTKRLSELFHRLIQQPRAMYGKIINIGSGQAHSLKEIVLYLKQALQSTSSIEFGAIPAREDESGLLMGSLDTLESILNHTIRFDLFKDLDFFIGLEEEVNE